jgi:transposase
MAASVWQVRDELWQVIEPLLPRHEPGPRGGRPRVDDRVAFGAIVFVLVTGIAWRHLPAEWAARRRRPTAGSSSGSAPASSAVCTASCCGGSTPPGVSTGPTR